MYRIRVESSFDCAIKKLCSQTVCFIFSSFVTVGENSEFAESQFFGQSLSRFMNGSSGRIDHVNSSSKLLNNSNSVFEQFLHQSTAAGGWDNYRTKRFCNSVFGIITNDDRGDEFR